MRDTMQNELSYITVNPRKNISQMKSTFSLGCYVNPLFIIEPPLVRKNVNLSIYKESIGNSLQPIKNFEYYSFKGINKKHYQSDSIGGLLKNDVSVKIEKEASLLNCTDSNSNHKRHIIPNYTYVPKVTLEILPIYRSSQKPYTYNYSSNTYKSRKPNYSSIKKVPLIEKNGNRTSEKAILQDNITSSVKKIKNE